MTVAVVVLNWHSSDYIASTLTSLLALRNPQVKLSFYLVDNHSPLETVRQLVSQFPQFILIRNPSDYGLAEGYNVGLRRALASSPDFVWTVSPDVLPNPDCLVELLTAAAKYHNAGIFGPKAYQPSKKVLYAGGQLDWNQTVVTPRGFDQDDVGQFDFAVEADYVPFYCLFARSSVLDQVGLFDRRYFLHLADVDLCQRAKRHGWKLMFVPLSQIVKTGQFESELTSDQLEYFDNRNRFLISTKLGPVVIKIAALREAFTLSKFGTPWQKRASQDYLFGRFGSGSVESI